MQKLEKAGITVKLLKVGMTMISSIKESPSVSLIYKEIIYKIILNECRTDVKGYLKHNIF